MARTVDVKRGSETLLTGVRWCASFFSRLRGLMFRSGLQPGEALILAEAADSRTATSIHMFFVPFAIATVWIDGRGRVVDKVLARPWRPYYAPRAPARYVLETEPAFLERIEIGDEIVFEPRPSDAGR
jgi:uncharacterized membrane protein (UPF0127 family)